MTLIRSPCQRRPVDPAYPSRLRIEDKPKGVAVACRAAEGRRWKMSGEQTRRRVGVAAQQIHARLGRAHWVEAKARRPFGMGELHRMVHDVAEQHGMAA